jgi:hypothetical protein
MANWLSLRIELEIEKFSIDPELPKEAMTPKRFSVMVLFVIEKLVIEPEPAMFANSPLLEGTLVRMLLKREKLLIEPEPVIFK